jgi:hypothetical protein
VEYGYFLLQGHSALLQTSLSNFSHVTKHVTSSRAYSAIAITADYSTAYISVVQEQGEDNQISSLLEVSLYGDFYSSVVAQESGWGWQGVALQPGDSTAYVVGSDPTGLHYQSELWSISLPGGGRQEVASDSPDLCAVAINSAGSTLYAVQCDNKLLSLELSA